MWELVLFPVTISGSVKCKDQCQNLSCKDTHLVVAEIETKEAALIGTISTGTQQDNQFNIHRAMLT
jgi:hypothetical protein